MIHSKYMMKKDNLTDIVSTIQTHRPRTSSASGQVVDPSGNIITLGRKS